jgi:hypothetical protein
MIDARGRGSDHRPVQRVVVEFFGMNVELRFMTKTPMARHRDDRPAAAGTTRGSRKPSLVARAGEVRAEDVPPLKAVVKHGTAAQLETI